MTVRILLLGVVLALLVGCGNEEDRPTEAGRSGSTTAPQATYERFIQVIDPGPSGFAGRVAVEPSPDSLEPPGATGPSRCYSDVLVEAKELTLSRPRQLVRNLGSDRTDEDGRWRIPSNRAGKAGLYVFRLMETSLPGDGATFVCAAVKSEVQIDPGAGASL